MSHGLHHAESRFADSTFAKYGVVDVAPPNPINHIQFRRIPLADCLAESALNFDEIV